MKRFTDKIDSSNACHLWTAGTDQNGYGRFRFNGKRVKAHRLAFELAFGPIEDGLEIAHVCNNKLCVNIEHLKAVTPQEHWVLDRELKRHSGRKGGQVGGRKGGLAGRKLNLPEGVRPNGKRFMARARVNGQQVYIGTFDTPEEASSAYRKYCGRTKDRD